MTQEPATEASPVRPLTADEEAVVRALPRLVHGLPRAIDAEMIREQGLSTTEYLALMHLSEAPDRQLRMGDLAEACEMSLSGTTRIVNRLESQGFVRRVRCDHDGRGWRAALTDAGLARLEEAWPTNLAAVRRHFLDHLAGLDLEQLAAALRNVAT
ncbi:MarR family winged helix-turn-helix transcriptional regulator [Streptomyces chromofuscus]|uniref:MarR family winged helix-turn-helix transcriptional regulator n=1 Tax=Streptomyces chromofuscus TaxID=42881 RepID=UPI00167B7114|nr:MarR family transcriptional regulator [Streptomyces chromofuscus]GGT15752.1 MarR family transcriptional regulator [Streptomyces chromofuscus]